MIPCGDQNTYICRPGTKGSTTFYALCGEMHNTPANALHKRPVMRSFDVFFLVSIKSCWTNVRVFDDLCVLALTGRPYIMHISSYTWMISKKSQLNQGNGSRAAFWLVKTCCKINDKLRVESTYEKLFSEMVLRNQMRIVYWRGTSQIHDLPFHCVNYWRGLLLKQ